MLLHLLLPQQLLDRSMVPLHSALTLQQPRQRRRRRCCYHQLRCVLQALQSAASHQAAAAVGRQPAAD
jgi:hypothetical protein